MERYDLIVIGGGPGGYNAAERAAETGMRVLLLEKDNLGGVCLNEGCIPSKTLLHTAKVYDYARHGDKYGVTAEKVTVSQEKVIARKKKVVKTLVSGVTAKLKQAKVDVIHAPGMIQGRKPEGFSVAAQGQEYIGEKLLIATGSSAIVPPIPGLREGLQAGQVVTNHEIFDIAAIPAKMAVIGGGVIGLEMASYFNSVGSEVTVVEMLDYIAGETDREISGLLLDAYQKKGIRFLLGAKVVAVEKDKILYEKDGKQEAVPAELILCSIGRRAVTEGYGLETLGVYLERGAIKTDEQMRTNIAGVYAVGDVNGVSMLAHTAYREGEVAVNHICGKPDRMRYHAIPAVIYTNPEVASVGETEASAKAKGYETQTVKMTMRVSGRYIAENEGGNGICKIIVDKKYRRILGVHMIGSYVSEMIYGAALMIETEVRVNDLKEIVFPHPTVSEVLRESLFLFE